MPTFPKIGNKHRFTPLFTPAQGVGRIERIPEKVILIYSRSFEKRLRMDLQLKRFPTELEDRVFITKNHRAIVIRLSIGAPLTAATVEEAIFCGGRRFLILGTAGALDRRLSISDIVLCKRAIRDERTSPHYLANSKYAYPSKGLTDSLARAMRTDGIKHISGTTWSIDAPYAETKEEVRHYQNEGVKTVEMEAAALFAVAKKRRVEAAAIFTVSDMLDDVWSGFQTKNYEKDGYARLSRIAELFSRLE